MNINRLICRHIDGEMLADNERVAVEHEHLLAGIRESHSRIRNSEGTRVRWTYNDKGICVRQQERNPGHPGCSSCCWSDAELDAPLVAGPDFPFNYNER